MFMVEHCLVFNLETETQFRFGIRHLLIIKLLYVFYSDMFTINGFIQLSILLVYSLIMVTGMCNRNVSIFL